MAAGVEIGTRTGTGKGEKGQGARYEEGRVEGKRKCWLLGRGRRNEGKKEGRKEGGLEQADLR